MNKNILLFLNTPYHVETAFSLYESIRHINYIPYILIDFQKYENDNGFGVIEFCQKYGLNYLTPKEFDEISDPNFFHKMVLITATNHSPELLIPEVFEPLSYNHRMQMYKDRAILIYHKADYSEYLKYTNYFFENPKFLSVTNFSQKHGLPFIFQVENPVSKIKTNFLEKEVINFLFIGRFHIPNRSIDLLENLINIEKKLTKQVKINFIGQKFEKNLPEEFKKNLSRLTTLAFQNLKNIKYEFHFNVDQITLYEKIYNSDFFLNLIDDPAYVTDRFTSNLNHIIAFSKPNINPLFVNLAYNIPGLNYVKNFEKVFIEAVNLEETKYSKMVKNFNIVKENMRSHNSTILSNLLN